MENRLFRITIIIMFVVTFISANAFAYEQDVDNDEVKSNSNLQYETEADSWRYKDGYLIQNEDSTMFRSRAAYTPWSKVDGGFINSRGEIIEGAIKKGIDVSEFQGNIDWQTVKNSGIDFAIIRCGYGSDYSDQDDAKWLRNVSECERLGIPYGVYIYSYANTTAKARSEAEHVLRLLKGHNPTYPVYYDLEDKVVSNAGRSAIINFANIFCSTIEANGYKAGIYANLNWWDTKLNDSSLNKYEKWVAQWNYRCTYDGDYRLWQCTSDGSVPGISGRVDLNFEFLKADSIVDVADYDIVLTANRNVRTGPSTTFKIVDYYDKGRYITITHKSGEWGKIKGTDDWIELLTSKRIDDVADYNVILIGGRNVRTGPDTSFNKVDYYKAGKEFTITHKSGEWGKIKDTNNWIELSSSKSA